MRLLTMTSGGRNNSGRGKRLLFTVSLAGFLFSLMAIPVPGASVIIISAQQQLLLADAFFNEAEYDRAITEYRRFLSFFPDDTGVDYAGYRIALSYFRLQKVERALSLFEEIYSRGADHPYAVEACFMAGRCYLALGRPVPAITILQELMASVDDIAVQDRARYHIGWIYLESEPVLNNETVRRADEYFSGISETGRDAYNVGGITGQLRNLSVDKQGPLLSRKNSKLAGTLAVFPGAGYVYCGRYHDALISFLLVGGMACAAGESFDHDLEALGAVISLVGFGFYSGSIYGSVSAAHKYNRARSREFLNRINGIRVDVAPAAKGDGAMVSLRVPF